MLNELILDAIEAAVGKEFPVPPDTVLKLTTAVRKLVDGMDRIQKLNSPKSLSTLSIQQVIRETLAEVWEPE